MADISTIRCAVCHMPLDLTSPLPCPYCEEAKRRGRTIPEVFARLDEAERHIREMLSSAEEAEDSEGDYLIDKEAVDRATDFLFPEGAGDNRA